VNARPATAVPPDVVSAADYERRARATLPADTWAYIAGAGADGLTQHWNREAFDTRHISGCILADMTKASTGSTLFGAPLACPILIAPIAYHKLVHPDGERGRYRRAAASSSPPTADARSTPFRQALTRWTLSQRTRMTGYRYCSMAAFGVVSTFSKPSLLIRALS
jgi:4-hydroxymandelate oxidase